MNDPHARLWIEANQRHLMAAVECVRTRIECRLASAPPDAAARLAEAERRFSEAQAGLPAPSTLELITRRFGLSSFERDLLVLCAGVELDTRCATACAEAQGDLRRSQATFGLALSALPEAHWSALTPAGALRRWKLVEVTAGTVLTTNPLRIDERILHALAGVNYPDEHLRGLAHPVPVPNGQLAPSHRARADQVTRLWREHPSAILLLGGPETTVKPSVVAVAAAALDSPVFLIRGADLPLTPLDRESLARIWEREAALLSATLVLEVDDDASAETQRAVRAFVEDLHARVAVAMRDSGDGWRRVVHRIEIERLPMAEQQALWGEALGPLRHALNGEIERVAGQFSLPPNAIVSAGAEAHATAGVDDPARLSRALWESCRRLARPQMEDLAQRIDSPATWEDLVLPTAQSRSLREIAAQVRERFQVYERWGFATKLARGLGITALFAGASGTGKTLAAEILAHELRLDLYRIDLSSVVSKYIGETEKNLRRVFDAAEAGGAILLFDEADALFGKRSEVKDSHDRYANIEISYLLQRMESYRGLAILTTNLKNVLDQAFLRRLRFVIQFPFPNLAERIEIWRRVFPSQTPHEGLDPQRLAQLNLPGGNIRNIALNAAFLAAEARQPVRMPHLLAATRTEYAKLEKPLTEAEIGGWI